jgi:hypothetical protein
MYKVGQILYTLIENKHAIFPVQVIEEVTIKNLESETTTYKVLLPNSKNQKVDLNRFDKVFPEINSASNYLLENAKKAISDMLVSSKKLEVKFLKGNIEKEELKSQVDIVTCNNEKESVKIDLGDGQLAKVNIENISNYLDENIQEEIQKKT